MSRRAIQQGFAGSAKHSERQKAEWEYKAMPVTDRSAPLCCKRGPTSSLTALHIRTSTTDPTPKVADSLTWSQVYSRACIIAEELKLCGLPGDRVAVLAPQGLEYVLAFLGALQAGFIAVPLSTPQYGIHDDRVSAVLQDSKPVAILTTSSVVGDVTKYAASHDGQPAPVVVEVDLLDLDSPRQMPAFSSAHRAAYLNTRPDRRVRRPESLCRTRMSLPM